MANYWKPTGPGDTTEGIVTGYFSTSTKYGPQQFAVIETAPDEQVIVGLSHTVLRRRFEDLTPAVGAELCIEYLGKPEGKNWHDYAVMLYRQGEGLPYAPIDDEPQEKEPAAQERPADIPHSPRPTEAPRRTDTEYGIEATRRLKERRKQEREAPMTPLAVMKYQDTGPIENDPFEWGDSNAGQAKDSTPSTFQDAVRKRAAVSG